MVGCTGDVASQAAGMQAIAAAAVTWVMIYRCMVADGNNAGCAWVCRSNGQVGEKRLTDSSAVTYGYTACRMITSLQRQCKKCSCNGYSAGCVLHANSNILQGGEYTLT